MKNKNHIIRLVILSIIGSILIFLTYHTKYSDGVVEIISILGIGLIGMVFWILQIGKDEKAFANESILKARFSLLLGFLFVLDIVFIRFSIISLRGATSLIVISNYQEDIGISIDLKENNTYVLQEHGFLGSDYEYGTYTLKDNTINFDRKLQRLGAKRILIQPSIDDLDAYFTTGNTGVEYFALPIDENGNKYSSSKYKVVEDNRYAF